MHKRATGGFRGIAAGLPVALFAAVFAAVAGTALHRQYLALAGVELHWGPPAALLLLAALQLLLAGRYRSLIPTAVAGIGCYVLVGLLAAAGPGKQLILGDVPGNVWVYGIAVVTLVMLVVCRGFARRN
ncbi:hypothetical protein BIU82_02535 [Arthrobacter sp. SW1]|nr:hypothetical protein BIU82_02535 [Arthrobacter sp. SW1]